MRNEEGNCGTPVLPVLLPVLVLCDDSGSTEHPHASSNSAHGAVVKFEYTVA